MDNNFYLILLATLVGFFFIAIFYSKNNLNQSKFGEINESKSKINVNHLDTRYAFPTVSPVNPVIYNSVVLKTIPVDKGLYSTQELVKEFILDQTIPETNQLNYSGGTNELIKIPLQMNEPYNEQLRTQDILITPYNRVKYKMDC